MTEKTIEKKKSTGTSAARIEKLEGDIKQTNDKVVSLTDAVMSLVDIVKKSSSDASNRPVAMNNHFESDEQSLDNEGSVEFDDANPDQFADRPSDIETEVFTTDKLRDLSFNEEKIRVDIHTTSDKDADQVFEIEVNGQKEFFRRGENKVVARKFVEGLARAKPINYENEEYLGSDGNKHVRYPTRKGLRYSFSLVNPKPIDTAWLQAILAQP